MLARDLSKIARFLALFQSKFLNILVLSRLRLVGESQFSSKGCVLIITEIFQSQTFPNSFISEQYFGKNEFEITMGFKKS